MAGLFEQFPIFLGAVPPDLIDEDGVPLLEGNSRRYPEYRAGIAYRPCPYRDSRFGKGLPMNIPALRPLIGYDSVWRAATYLFVRASRSRALPCTTLALSSTFGVLPYLTRPGRAVPRDEARLFKFFRGIRFFAEHSSIFCETSASMFGHSNQHGLLIGDREVCPAPQPLIDETEREIQSILNSDPAFAHVETPDHWDDRVGAAVEVALLFNAFAVVIASYGASRGQATTTESAVRESPLLPMPFWLAARQAALSPEKRDAFALGIRRFSFASGVPEKIQATVDELLESTVGASNWPLVADTVMELNAQLRSLLGLLEPMDDEFGRSSLWTVLHQ